MLFVLFERGCALIIHSHSGYFHFKVAPSYDVDCVCVCLCLQTPFNTVRYSMQSGVALVNNYFQVDAVSGFITVRAPLTGDSFRPNSYTVSCRRRCCRWSVVIVDLSSSLILSSTLYCCRRSYCHCCRRCIVVVDVAGFFCHRSIVVVVVIVVVLSSPSFFVRYRQHCICCRSYCRRRFCRRCFSSSSSFFLCFCRHRCCLQFTFRFLSMF